MDDKYLSLMSGNCYRLKDEQEGDDDEDNKEDEQLPTFKFESSYHKVTGTPNLLVLI